MPSTAAQLRVLQVVLTLGVGGTERLVIDLVRKLTGRIASSVCCIDEAGAWAPELTALDIPVAALNRAPGFQPGLARRIARVAADFHADVVHCHQYSPFVYGQLAALLNRRLRVVFTEHGRLSDAAPSIKRRMVNGMLGRLGAQIFAVSHNLREHMVAEGLPATRVGVIHNGIDVGPEPAETAARVARERLGLSRSSRVLGTVARLDPVKDFDTMLEATALVRDRHPDVKLVIVGDGQERARIESTIARRQLGASVVLAGHRPDARELLPAFDVYLNTSLSEGISIAVLEAMAATRPVIATRVGGNPEVVEHGRTGYLVPTRGVVELAAAAASLLDSARERHEFGQAGRARVLSRFTFDRMANQYWQAYQNARRSRSQ
jgi:glycosyltransferase involved in cell wall biosynthesis